MTTSIYDKYIEKNWKVNKEEYYAKKLLRSWTYLLTYLLTYLIRSPSQHKENTIFVCKSSSSNFQKNTSKNSWKGTITSEQHFHDYQVTSLPLLAEYM